MDRPGRQLTVRQMMGLVAICALVLGFVRSPMWLLVIALFGLPPAGYVIDRMGGGPGTGGSMVGGAIGFPLCFTTVSVFLPSGNLPQSLLLTALAAPVLVIGGLAWGGVLGLLTYSCHPLRTAACERRIAAGSVPGRTGPVADEDGAKEISWHEGGET